MTNVSNNSFAYLGFDIEDLLPRGPTSGQQAETAAVTASPASLANFLNASLAANANFEDRFDRGAPVSERDVIAALQAGGIDPGPDFAIDADEAQRARWLQQLLHQGEGAEQRGVGPNFPALSASLATPVKQLETFLKRLGVDMQNLSDEDVAQLLIALALMSQEDDLRRPVPQTRSFPTQQGSAPWVNRGGAVVGGSPYAPASGGQSGQVFAPTGTAQARTQDSNASDGVTHVVQTGNNCGPCSFVMAMQSLGVAVPGGADAVANARALMGSRADGFTNNMSQVTQAGRAAGVEAQEFRGAGGGPVRASDVHRMFDAASDRDAAIVLSGVPYGGHLIAVTGRTPEGGFMIRDSMTGGMQVWSDEQLNQFIANKPDAAVALYR